MGKPVVKFLRGISDHSTAQTLGLIFKSNTSELPTKLKQVVLKMRQTGKLTENEYNDFVSKCEQVQIIVKTLLNIVLDDRVKSLKNKCSFEELQNNLLFFNEVFEESRNFNAQDYLDFTKQAITPMIDPYC